MIIDNNTLLKVCKDKSKLSQDEYSYKIKQNDKNWINITILSFDDVEGELYLNLHNNTYSYNIDDPENFCDYDEFNEDNLTILMQVRELAKELLSFINEIKSAKKE